jgi:uncharacterized protein (DUF302 family)
MASPNAPIGSNPDAASARRRDGSGAAGIVLVHRQEKHMEETRLGLRIEVPATYDQAVERVTAALKAQGFGVLTTIDVQRTLKEKLDLDFRHYVILGACNPSLAARALAAEPEIGLLLPCNVVVDQQSSERCTVSAMAPLVALGFVGDNAELQAVAVEADRRLRAALATLESATA